MPAPSINSFGAHSHKSITHNQHKSFLAFIITVMFHTIGVLAGMAEGTILGVLGRPFPVCQRTKGDQTPTEAPPASPAEVSQLAFAQQGAVPSPQEPPEEEVGILLLFLL